MANVFASHLGPVHTNPNTFWNRILFVRIGIPPTRNEFIHTPKPPMFEAALQSGFSFLDPTGLDGLVNSCGRLKPDILEVNYFKNSGPVLND